MAAGKVTDLSIEAQKVLLLLRKKKFVYQKDLKLVKI